MSKKNKKVQFNEEQLINLYGVQFAIASASNAGKVYLKAGTPLAINYAEWLAFLRYLVPSVKYWIFDRSKLELEHMEKISDEEWAKLLDNGTTLLERAYDNDSDSVVLKA